MKGNKDHFPLYLFSYISYLTLHVNTVLSKFQVNIFCHDKQCSKHSVLFVSIQFNYHLNLFDYKNEEFVQIFYPRFYLGQRRNI